MYRFKIKEFIKNNFAGAPATLAEIKTEIKKKGDKEIKSISLSQLTREINKMCIKGELLIYFDRDIHPKRFPVKKYTTKELINL